MGQPYGRDFRISVQGPPIEKAPRSIAHLLDCVHGAAMWQDCSTGDVTIVLQRDGEEVARINLPGAGKPEFWP